MEERQPLLKVDDLHVSFFTPVGEVKAVNGIPEARIFEIRAYE